ERWSAPCRARGPSAGSAPPARSGSACRSAQARACPACPYSRRGAPRCGCWGGSSVAADLADRCLQRFERGVRPDLHVAGGPQQHEVAAVAATLLVATRMFQQDRRRRTVEVERQPVVNQQLVDLLAHGRVEPGKTLGEPERDPQAERDRL